MNPIRRSAARVVIIDDFGCVLLLRHVDPLSGSAHWATPGGGLQDGESFEQAARRELAEELGMAVADVGPRAWDRDAEFEFLGRPHLQHECFFVIRTARFAIPAHVAPIHAAEYVDDHRWWSVGDLEATAETLWPEDLAARVRDLGSLRQE